MLVKSVYFPHPERDYLIMIEQITTVPCQGPDNSLPVVHAVVHVCGGQRCISCANAAQIETEVGHPGRMEKKIACKPKVDKFFANSGSSLTRKMQAANTKQVTEMYCIHAYPLHT